MSVGMEGHLETPMPRGMVWNMVYDENAPVGSEPFISHEELWRRLGAFLDEVIPVAEEAGVKLALHPDDPPLPTMRGQPRLVYDCSKKLAPRENTRTCCKPCNSPRPRGRCLGRRGNREGWDW